MFTATQRQILRAISESGPLSRTELTSVLGLSKAAMSGLARDLIDKGVLQETVQVYGQGRPSLLLDIHPGCAFLIGVSLLQDPAPIVMTDLGGEIVAEVHIPLSRDPEKIAAEIAASLSALLNDRPGSRERLAGIGIALSGFVDRTQSRCVQSTLLGWQDVPLAEIVAAKVDVPVFIENDAKAVAVSEKLFGEAREVQNFSLVSLGDGIGCAHFIDGKLYRGNHGGAGEIAHLTIEPGGAPCRCGKRGCLDTVASMKAIRESARAEGLICQTLDEIETEAATGNTTAIRILHRAGSALGLAIAHIIQLNDPGEILVTHDEYSFDGLLGTVMRQAIEANVLPRQANETAIRTLRVDETVWARGAAAIAAHRFLVGPAGPQQ
ncbi:transcriptional regulator [Brucella endophytica]|uniref:Transcriptional regulator n=1 Tax=Brucella endophytica TaxID=1963359 RepID=A0A916S852_9HYPH|nr:ROK family transcriptional regulator [Brucella endophytica]GGA86431.1 transcriptional regulator [Brucella endophytica]